MNKIVAENLKVTEQVLTAVFAENDSEIIREGIKAGVEAASARGKVGGWLKSLS